MFPLTGAPLVAQAQYQLTWSPPIEQPPNIFTIVINRFNLALAVSKNINKIILDREILVFSNRYILVSSIHHHGSTITSGLYIANVYCTESAYTCNDNHIIPLNYLEPSDSVYIAFYAHSSHLSQQNQRMGLNSHGTGTSSAQAQGQRKRCRNRVCLCFLLMTLLLCWVVQCIILFLHIYFVFYNFLSVPGYLLNCHDLDAVYQDLHHICFDCNSEVFRR